MTPAISRVRWLLGSVLTLSTVLAAAQERTMAIWKEHELNFTYRSAYPTHSCHDLQSRVASVLVVLGARPDVKVSASGCDAIVTPMEGSSDFDRSRGFERPGGFGSWPSRPGTMGSDRLRNDPRRDEQWSHVRIRVLVPVEVNEETLAEWKKEKSRRELIARVKGDPTPILEMTGQFPAEWQRVTLNGRTARLEPEDCELLEQMSRTVLRDLSVRKIRMNSNCSSRMTPQLTAEALISTPYRPPAQNQKSVAEKTDGEPSPTLEDVPPPESTAPTSNRG